MIICQYCGDELALEELPTHRDSCTNWQGKDEERPNESSRFVKLSLGWVNTSFIIRFGSTIDEETEHYFLVLSNEIGEMRITSEDYKALVGRV